MNQHDLDVPVRLPIYGLFKSLTFYQNYLNLNVVFKELIEEMGFTCPMWLEYDIDTLQDKVERYLRD